MAKIETLEKLAELLKVSVPTLLGVGVEYIASAVSYFERMRQIEETAEHIIVLAGPISYRARLRRVSTGRSARCCARSSGQLRRPQARAGADRRTDGRCCASARRPIAAASPAIVNLIAAAEMERFLRNGLVGRHDLPERRAPRTPARWPAPRPSISPR